MRIAKKDLKEAAVESVNYQVANGLVLKQTKRLWKKFSVNLSSVS